jgi:hypothetical protein
MTITPSELELHAKWVKGEPGGRRLIKPGADLHGVSLSGVNLHGAILRGADLRDADLCDADLSVASLCGAMGLLIAADAATRLQAVAEAALQPGALRMDAWHSCGTAHCIAGWAIHLAGEPGRIMESMMGSHLAGLLLLGVEAAEHFYDSNDKAMEYLQSVLSGSR